MYKWLFLFVICTYLGICSMYWQTKVVIIDDMDFRVWEMQSFY